MRMRFFETIPQEVKEEIRTYLSDYERLLVLSFVSKEFKTIVQHHLAMKTETSYPDFLQRIQLLSPKLRYPIISGHYRLDFAEGIMSILVLPPNERLQTLFTAEQLAALDPLWEEPLSSDYGIIALFEKLITIDQINQIALATSQFSRAIKCLFIDEGYCGIEALRERFFTLEQIAGMPDPFAIKFLISKQGINALREGLITFEQAKVMPYPYSMTYLFTRNGITALRERLLTLEQVNTILPFTMEILSSDNGILALREQLITVEQLAILSVTHIELLLSNSGIWALGAKLITVKQAANYSVDELKTELLQLIEHGLAKQGEYSLS